MKKDYTIKSAAALMCLLPLAVSAQNQWKSNASSEQLNKERAEAPAVVNAESEMNIGYVDDGSTIYQGYGIGGFPEATRVGVAIKLEKELLDKYVGAKITSLALGYSSMTSTEADLFVKTNITSEERLASGSGNLEYGWGNYSLDTPVEITSDMDEIYVGYYATINANEYSIPAQTYAIVPNSCYLWTEDDMTEDGQEVWADYYDQFGMLMIKATITGEEGQFDNMATINFIHNYDMHIVDDEPGHAIFIVQNYGMKPIESLEVSYKSETQNFEQNVALSDLVMPGSKKSLVMPFPHFNSGEMKVSLTKVNDQENIIANEMSIKVFGIEKEAAAKYTKKPVIEYFESETSSLVPEYYTNIFWPGFEPYSDRFSMLARHIDDQYMVRDYEDLKMQLDLVANDSMSIYIPAICVDRTDIIDAPYLREYGPMLDHIYPDFVAPVYEAALNIPTFASVNIAGGYTSENTVSITVSGHIEEGVVVDNEPLFLSVFVTESNVDASNQETGKEPIEGFVHDNVIRLQPTPMYGDQLENSFGDYSKTYEVELEPDWKKEDMKIVAFINRGPETNNFDKQIINSESVSFNKISVENNYMDNSCLRVYGENGKVVAEGEYTDMKVFDLTGKAVENKDLNGYYIVKINADNNCSLHKVIVK